MLNGMMLGVLNKPKRYCNKQSFYQLNSLRYSWVRELLGREFYFMGLLELGRLF